MNNLIPTQYSMPCAAKSLTPASKTIPDAMALVDVLTIQKWKNQMIQWMNAYWEGKGTKEAHIQVKKFGSCKQSSHHWVYAQIFD